MSRQILNCIRVLPQYLVPQHLLSRAVYHLTRCRWPWLKNMLINAFIRIFRVDLDPAEEPDVKQYPHFNAFFTRSLKPSARTVSNLATDIVSPVDGFISQIGGIVNAEIFQAKQRSFGLLDLLANDTAMAGEFSDGQFATLYLSPGDYHRVHMPFDGTLKAMIHVPGRLFAVNRHTAEVVNRLFARNERIISFFDTRIGPMAIVLIGAMLVGSMETVWAGRVIPSNNRTVSTTSYDDLANPVTFNKGDEIGRFNMGSTVIVLFARDRMRWLNHLKGGDQIAMGMTLGITQGT